MFRVILQKFVIFLVCNFVVESTDILNLFRPKPDLPQELNDFLVDVQKHKKDFAFIRNVARNRKQYEKSYRENHNLFAEDLDNQLTLAPYYSNRLDNLDNQNSRKDVYDQIVQVPQRNQEKNFRSYYPNERYSRFIHSPVRLERGLDTNYFDTQVKLNPNGMYGEIKKPDQKFPSNRFVNNEGNYRAGRMVDMEDDDIDNDYSALKSTNKKKREVEISIKSDGKLVKRIEEDENGPKSIVLNIKAPSSDEKSLILSGAGSQASQLGGGTTAVGLSTVQPLQNNKNLENGPSNSKTIPSLINPNKSGASKNVGVPINSIPAGNSGVSSNKNAGSSLNQKENFNNELNAEDGKEPVNQEKSGQVSKVSNSDDARQKSNLYSSKLLGNNFENSRWTGDSSQIAKSIDIAQNNVKFGSFNDRPNVEADLEEPKKDSEFEKVEGLVVDSTDVNGNNINENKIKFANKRDSIKNKRWIENFKAMDGSNIPINIQDIQSNGATVFDYPAPIKEEAIDLSLVDPSQAVSDSIHWNMEDRDLHLNPDEKYEVIEQSTKDTLFFPIIETTSCPIDLHGSNDDNLNEESKIIGDAIIQEIKKEEEKEKADAEAEKEAEETTECEEHSPNHREEEEKGAEIEIITHERGEEDKHCHHTFNKESHGHTKPIEIRVHDSKTHENHNFNHKNHNKKRQVVKKKNKKKYVIKQKRDEANTQYSYGNNKQVPNKFKRDQDKENNWDDDSLRNRKHMPPVPKYKKKRIRQHPKKRVNRLKEEPSFVDYYNFNELYGSPEDTFDFIPSFSKRRLQFANYEYDPNLIHDIGDHAEEEIKKFEQAQDEKEKLKKNKFEDQDVEDEKLQGHRKKFKSEGDYSDEEESSKSATDKVPKKKSKNQFAPDTQETTEDNDDDYNYDDLTDMEDEQEDVAYEEEKSDNINVDEAIGRNNQSDEEKDRLNFENVFTEYLAEPRRIVEPTTKRYRFVIMKAFSPIYDKKFLGDVHDSDSEEVKRNQNDKESVAHGHGSSKKKHKHKKQSKHKKKPKRNDESDRFEQTELNQDLADDVSSFHGRGNKGFKLVKHKQVKSKRQDTEPVNQKGNGLTKEKVSDQFEEKPMSNQEKQDIFLRYNPDFQRWPRFVQSDNKYKELMKKRALEHQKMYFRNSHNMKRFPISSEYFLNPEEPQLAKREEPSTETATGTSSSAASEAASSEAEASQASTAESFAEEKEQASETTPNMDTASPIAQDNVAGATLPQAAQNILQTANSDIFENTTAPSMESAANGNASAGVSDSKGFSGEGTQFQFTTNADDLTENTECMTPQSEISPCPDESGSHIPVTVTSVLPLLPESATLLKINMTKSEYLDLNDIVGGALPRNIVSNSLSRAKGNLRHGLNTGKFNMNLNISNFNSNSETKMILKEMTNLMLKLKYHTTCQALPDNLQTYVKLITRNEMDSPMSKLKEMDEIDFDEHQSSYVFHGAEGENVQNKAQALKDLLNKYNKLPDNCKERAEPVREYIESHLAMIDNVGGNKGVTKSPAAARTDGNSTVHPKAKKEINLSNLDNTKEKALNGQMMEEGLNNQQADANEAIEDKNKKSKREAMDSGFPPVFHKELSTSTSPEYGKLAEAVRNFRHRRESAKRIGEIYGRAKRDEDNVENEEQSKKDRGFEAPQVINF